MLQHAAIRKDTHRKEVPMLISKYFVWFIIYSFFGWVYESAFCTIKAHEWRNRGFLHGPIVPIYGVGALAASIIFSELPVEKLHSANNLQIFIVCFLGSIVLEYVTSWGLEKLFHAYWWDYSNVFGNINGRVCLPASIGFGLAGILVVRVVLPLVSNMTLNTHPLLLEALSLIFMLLFGMDLALTVSTLTNFTKNLERIEKEINDQIAAAYDNLEANIAEKRLETQESIDASKEAFAAKKEDFTEKTAEKTAALRSKLTNERLEEFFASSSLHQRHTLINIKGYQRDGQSKEYLEKLKRMIKERKR